MKTIPCALCGNNQIQIVSLPKEHVVVCSQCKNHSSFWKFKFLAIREWNKINKEIGEYGK